jgi:NitT/TauT family transport system ATP-binding protein
MIQIKDLSVSYRNNNNEIKAIEEVNLNIESGRIYTIIGPSGVGKSTLLKALSGIIDSYKGEILINGRCINPRIDRIGFIPQNYGLVDWKTVQENIMLSAKIKDGKKKIDIKFYRYLLDKLKINEIVNRYPKQLSGGQKQRVAIARAFLLKPNLLLMDEPFSALDAMTREEARELFLEIWKEHKVTTILVTHDIQEAIYLGQKIVVFSSKPGRVVRIADNLFFNEDCLEFNKQYFQLINSLRQFLKGDIDYEVEGP